MPSKASGVKTSQTFDEYRALERFATLDEVYKWRMGLYPQWFMAEVFVYNELKIHFDNHLQDAQYKKPKKGKGNR